MKGQKTLKRTLAMLLSLAMVMTSGVFGSLELKAAWYNPTPDEESDDVDPNDVNDEDGEAYGVVLKHVWQEEEGWNEDEDWVEYYEYDWRPEEYFKVAYKSEPGVEPEHVDPEDVKVTYYSEEQVEPRDWGRDARYSLAENAVGTEIEFQVNDKGYFKCLPENPGWYVFSLKNLTEYDHDFTANEDDGYTKISTFLSYGDEPDDEATAKAGQDARYVDDRQFMAVLHYTYQDAGFFTTGEKSRAGLIENWGWTDFDLTDEEPDVLYLIMDEGWDFYSDKEDKDENDEPNIWNDGEFLVEKYGVKYYGDHTNGVDGFFSVEPVKDAPGVYKLVLDENMRTDEFNIRVNFCATSDSEWRRDIAVNVRVDPRPYNKLFVGWPNWYDEDSGKEGVMLMDNGALSEWAWDLEDNRYETQRELYDGLGMDFSGGDIWLGYYDAEDDFHYALTDPSKLTVDYYEFRDDYYQNKTAIHTDVDAVKPFDGDDRVIHFDPVYSEGFYVITYKEDPAVQATIDVGKPGMGIYKTKECAKENRLDMDRTLLVKDNPQTYHLGLFENRWLQPDDEDEEREVYFDLSKIEINDHEGRGNAEFTLKEDGTISENDIGLKASDYITLSRGEFDDKNPNWYDLTLTAKEEGSFDVNFVIEMHYKEGDEDREDSRDYRINANVVNEGDIRVYSDSFERPEDPVWNGYCFTAINPIPVRFRITRVAKKDGVAVEESFSKQELSSIKLYSRFKQIMNEYDEPEDRWFGTPLEVKSEYGTVSVTDDGLLEVNLMQEGRQWVLKSDDGSFEFEFENCQPGIGFYTSSPRPYVTYGVQETLTQWLGWEETVYEIAGKKTTKPQAAYLWLWSDPANGDSAAPDKTVISIKDKENTKDYVVNQGELITGKDFPRYDKINYSGRSIELTDRASEDYTILVEKEKNVANYWWYGSADEIKDAYLNNWDEYERESWRTKFNVADDEDEDSEDEADALVAAVNAEKHFKPNADGSAMVETTDEYGLYILGDYHGWADEADVKEFEKKEYGEYTVHVMPFKSIQVTTQPAKKDYTEGESFSKSGMKVMAYYEDAAYDPVDVSDYVTVSVTGALKTTDKTVVVTYDGLQGKLTTQLPISVSAKAAPAPAPAPAPTPTPTPGPSGSGDQKQDTKQEEKPAAVGTTIAAASGAGANSQFKVDQAGDKSTNGKVTYIGEKTAPSGKLNIPDQIIGTDGVKYDVDKMDPNALKGATNVTELNVGNNITEIPKGACANMTGLKKVTLGKNVKSIAANAFSGDKKMKTLKMTGTNLQKIGNKAFYKTKVQTFDFSKQKKLTMVGANAFAGTPAKTIKLYVNKLKTIGSGSVKNLTGKKKVKFILYAKTKAVANKAGTKLKKGKGSTKVTVSFKKAK